MMTQEDPSDSYLNKHLLIISDTPARAYYADNSGKILVASWKPGLTANISPEDFQNTALWLAQLIETRKPTFILVDCRHLEHEITYEQKVWYIDQTRKLWLKSGIKKMAFVFKANLSVQSGMEGFKEVAQEESLPNIPFRIFENNMEAIIWLNN
jgi:hypothetical protein